MIIPILTVFLILTLYQRVSGQSLEDLDLDYQEEPVSEIIPGHGVHEITLGQSMELVTQIMGEPARRISNEEETASYKRFGYATDHQILFTTHFDICYTYTSPSNQSIHPIFKVYFKDKKVVYIVLSAYPYAKLSKYAVIDLELRFYANQRDMKDILGLNCISYLEPHGYKVFAYMDKGITLVFKENELVTITIYTPLRADIKDLLIPKWLLLQKKGSKRPVKPYKSRIYGNNQV